MRIFVLLAAAWAAGFDPAELFDLDRLHQPRSERILYEVSSFDREGRNIRDGFMDAHYLYMEQGEYVVLDESGPGVLVNFWTALDTTGRTTGDIRFLFDDDTVPGIALSGAGLFSGTLPLFPAGLTADDTRSSGGSFTFSPLPFKKRIKVRFTKKPSFYHFLFYRLKEGQGLSTTDVSADYRNLDLGLVPDTASSLLQRQAFRQTLAPGAFVQAAAITGSGVIRSLSARLPREGIEVLRNLTIIGVFDGATVPQIMAPLPDLFGCRNGAVPFASAAIRVDSAGTMVLYFPMPFKRSAAFYLRNDNRSLPVAVELAMAHTPESVADSAMTFYARLHHELGVYGGRDFTLCTASGRGHFAGSTLFLEGDRGRYFLEGDERFYVDGRSAPDLHGTGLEDYFLSGWYFRNGTYSLPANGYASSLKGGQEGMCLYRFHVSDCVPFYRSFKAGIERWPWNWGNTEYSAVSYYYLSRTPWLVLTDSLSMEDDTGREDHDFDFGALFDLRVLQSAYAGDSSSPRTRTGYYFSDSLWFNVRLDSANRGVLFRVATDVVQGGQAADLYVDSVFAGRWRISHENKFQRFFDADFFLPESLTAGKDSIRIRMAVPDTGERGAGFNFMGWEAYCIMPDTADPRDYSLPYFPTQIPDWSDGTVFQFEWGGIPCPPGRMMVYRDTVEHFDLSLRNLAGVANGLIFTDSRLSLGKEYFYRFQIVDPLEKVRAESNGALRVVTSALDKEGEDLFLSPGPASCSVAVHLCFNEDGEHSHLPDTAVASDKRFSGWRYLEMLAKRKGDSASFRVFANDRDTFEYGVTCALGPSFGSLEGFVNGRPAGLHADAFSESSGVSFLTAESLVVLEPGYNTFTFKSTGKHPRSTGYAMGVDRYRLLTMNHRYALIPDSLKLKILSCYPNPFNPVVKIKFDLAEDMDILAAVYDLNGRMVRLLSRKHYPRRAYTLAWDGLDGSGRACGSGLYFLRLKGGLLTRSARVVLIR